MVNSAGLRCPSLGLGRVGHLEGELIRLYPSFQRKSGLYHWREGEGVDVGLDASEAEQHADGCWGAWEAPDPPGCGVGLSPLPPGDPHAFLSRQPRRPRLLRATGSPWKVAWRDKPGVVTGLRDDSATELRSLLRRPAPILLNPSLRGLWGGHSCQFRGSSAHCPNFGALGQEGPGEDEQELNKSTLPQPAEEHSWGEEGRSHLRALRGLS